MTTPYDPPPEPVDEQAKEESGGALRKKLEQSIARVKELEAAAMDRAFNDLDLDPESGIGKAAAQTFDGDPAELGAYVATEYGYNGPQNPMIAQIAEAQASLDQISETAGSVPAESPFDQQLARAESTGDYQQTMAMKSQQVANLLNP